MEILIYLIFLALIGRFLYKTLRWLLRRWWKTEDVWAKAEAVVLEARFLRKEEGRAPSLGLGYRRFDLGTPPSYIYDARLEYEVDGGVYPITGEIAFPHPIEERRALDIVYQKRCPSVWEYADDRLVESEQAQLEDEQVRAWWFGLLIVPAVIFLALYIGLRYHGYSFADLGSGF